MNSTEKEQLYDFLKTVSSAVTGYTPKSFSGQKPKFADDIISADEENSFQNAELKPDSPCNDRLSSIAQKISQCSRCRLCQTRTQAVPGAGVENPLVLVIGEGPGHDEDLTGIPFVGKAGKLLDKMLAAISLSRSQNCFIANIVKCRPPQNRDPLPEEIAACESFLEAQTAVLKPKMILLMGRIAAQTILKTQRGITAIHGQFSVYNGIPVMPTYHPSALLRNETLKGPAWNDLKGFRAKLLELAPGYEKDFIRE